MPERELPERPEGELTSENTPHETESTGATLSHLLQEQVFGKLSVAQPGEDPAARPIQLMSQLQLDLRRKAYRERQDEARAEQLTAWKQRVNKVEMAYEILAYPHLENPDWRLTVKERILDTLEYPDINTQDHPHRAPIALNDEEVRTLSQLTQAVELPFDPEKRVYRYSDLAPLLESEHLVSEQSEPLRQAKQNAREAGMRARADIEERIRLRQAEWQIEGSDEPPAPPKPQK